MTISGVRYSLWGVRCIQELPKIVADINKTVPQRAPTIEVVAAVQAPDLRVSWSSSARSPCVPIMTLGRDCSLPRSRTALPPLRPGQCAVLTIEIRVSGESELKSLPSHLTVATDSESRGLRGELVALEGPAARMCEQDVPFVNGTACCKIRVQCVVRPLNFKVRLKIVPIEQGILSRSCVLHFATTVEAGLKAEGDQRSYWTGGVDGGEVRQLRLPADVRALLVSRPKDVIQNAKILAVTPVTNHSQCDGAALRYCENQMWISPTEQCNVSARCKADIGHPKQLFWKSAGVSGTVSCSCPDESAPCGNPSNMRFNCHVESIAVLASVRVSRLSVEISCSGNQLNGTLFVAYGVDLHPGLSVLGGCTRQMTVSSTPVRQTFSIGKKSPCEQRLFLGFAPSLRHVVFWHHAPILC
mmetsp:Transcript_52106/g.137841  ORF Transcript_52106/g.137841 Transcript_52106/m.137841 type:complete len:414 (+) Transcript_52106:1296-2537(+)